MNLKIMSDWEATRLADVLSIAEAACCIVGVPTTRLGDNTATEPYLQSSNWESPGSDEVHSVFTRVVHALTNSIKTGKLQAAKEIKGSQPDTHAMGEGAQTVDAIDPWTSLIDVDALKRWLISRNLRPPFFFPDEEVHKGEPDYLNPKHPRYSGRLAAAVNAWLAVTDTEGTSPKRALEKWLREHAAQYEMTNEEGNPINQTVEVCAKVANWDRNGGAPKTPQRQSLPPIKRNPPTP
ncbi:MULTISPECIES: hypothetical protein [unclassified Acidovorax]|uniref:hypothetical protein n=1 Tax=unclassified Acidovorax TaxID=2684926 RepID=UPI001C45ABF1|nr:MULTISPECIES: hypothetical protein [unclassified Acidovorax]MBV7459056.1 hypothetical protein [Acidovorax sp. sif0632]MBV7463122.1 hypothetical protein [Acidovorax sp. sif0613]